MPYSRPGYMAYVTRDVGDDPINHGDPVVEDNIVGVAVKQKATSWKNGFVGLKAIADGEAYAIITKGIVQVPNVAGFAKGDAVFITAATGVLSEAATGNVPFGRVVELVGDGRGVPTGSVRIDLDKKDSI